MADLDRILVIQNKLRVSYWNSSFVGEQGHPRAVGKYMPHLCGPSNPAASIVLVHSGTPNSSGAVASLCCNLPRNRFSPFQVHWLQPLPWQILVEGETIEKNEKRSLQMPGCSLSRRLNCQFPCCCILFLLHFCCIPFCNQQDRKNYGNEAASCINLIECPWVKEARQ